MTGRILDARATPAPVGRLGPCLAPWQVQIAKETMWAHLTSEIAVADVARICRLSMSHFIRAFSNTVGMAPYRLIRSHALAAHEGESS